MTTEIEESEVLFTVDWIALHANEDGTTDNIPIGVDFCRDANFKIQVPKYVSDSLAENEVVKDMTLPGAVEEYERLAEKYSLWRQTVGANRQLFVQIKVVDGGMSMRMHMVSTYADPDSGEMRALMFHDDDTPGDTIDLASGRIMPNTPEVREQVYRLIESIDTAGGILKGLRDTEDPVGYLSKIRNDFTLEPTPPPIEEQPDSAPVAESVAQSNSDEYDI